jgi:uncharacterized protein YcnI
MPRSSAAPSVLPAAALTGLGALALAVVGLAAAAPAAAHVTATAPNGATAGGWAKVVLSVPNERDDAGTTALSVALPAATPLAYVSAKPVPGWDVELTRTALPEPVDTGDTTLSEAVTRVTWTAHAGTRVQPGQFEEFALSVGPLPEDVPELVLPATQTYDSGEVVAWDEPPAPGGAEPEHPAPVVEVAPAEDEAAAADVQPVAATAPAGGGGEHGDDALARSLGGAGLVLGAGALFLAARRRA